MSMYFPKIENRNLLLDIFESERGVPSICSGLKFRYNNEIFFEPNTHQPGPKDTDKIYSIKFISGYLKADYRDVLDGPIRVRRYGQEKGYAINLVGITNIEAYIKDQLKSYGKTIKRSVNRLEKCLDVEYTMYYGELEKEHFNFLMDTLYQMIVARFKQRNETSENLKDWQWRCERAYHLIKEKRASLFVIYNKQKPIAISFNYNFNKVHFSYISSYDIDYSKFGLGHIDNYKQLEWCLDNNFEIFELGWGTLDYKRRWSNCIYRFEHHLVYPGRSITANIHTGLIGAKIRLKSYLVSKNVHVYIKNIKDKLRFSTRTKEELQFTMENIENIDSLPHFTRIDYNLDSYAFLRKIIYDFLYSNSVHEKDLKVFKMDNEKSYIIDSGKLIQKVIF
jgi:hypothetical protein